MQMFFDKTDQYAGNFAKESTQTVTGSIGLMSAAWESFTAGLGNSDADMKNLTGNLVDAFQAVIKNVVPIIENLARAIPDALSAVLPAIASLLPTLINTATSLFRQVLEALLTALPELIPVVVEALLTIVDALIDNLPLIVGGAVALVMALATGIGDALPELIPAVVEAVLTIVDNLLNNIDMLIDVAIDLIMALAEGMVAALPILIEKAPIIIGKLVAAIIQNAPTLQASAIELIKTLASGLAAGFSTILTSVGGWVQDNIVQPISNMVGKFAEIGGNLIAGLWNGIADKAEWLWSKVSGFFKSLTDRIKNLFGIESPSKLFRDEIGENLAAGIGVGFTGQMKSVAKQMNASIPTSFDSPTIRATTRALEGSVNGMAALMGAQGGGNYTINVVLPDGKALASVVFDPLRALSSRRGSRWHDADHNFKWRDKRHHATDTPSNRSG